MVLGSLLVACCFSAIYQGADAICNIQNEAEVLHVCTYGKRNGTRVVYLDNSKVPEDLLIDCFCSATVTSDDYTYLLTLDVENNSNCEIQFFVGPTRYCGSTNTTVGVTVGERMGEIKFEKSKIRDSTACLRLEIVQRDVDPDQVQKYNAGLMTVECFENEIGRAPKNPDEPRTAISHDDQHGTSRPAATQQPNVKQTVSNSSSGGVWSQCPACNCPACNCPACNCPPCNCSPDSRDRQQGTIINETVTEGHSSAVLIGCSIGLFVAGCIIGILITLGISHLRSNRV